MKMNIFILMVIAVLILLTKIVAILILDLNNLTKYGFGYLTGLTITFLMFLGITVLIGYQLFGKNQIEK